MYQQEPLVYIIDGDLSGLRRKLKKGNMILSRVVLKLSDTKYILRIFGYNLVMESKKNFDRFDEVNLKVKQVSPKLIMSIVNKKIVNKQGKTSGFGRKNTDLLV